MKKKIARYEWTNKCDEAFQELKKRISSALVLALPRSEERFVVYSDASRGGLACMLMREA